MPRLKRSAAAVVLTLLIPSAAFAELRRVELKVLGMDWAVCAHAVRVAMQKLPGVESVDVSLERASTHVALRPGNSIVLEQLHRIVKDNGFTVKESSVTVAGRLIERGGQPALQVTGTNTMMLIVADPKQAPVLRQVHDRLRRHPGRAVRVTGTVDSSPGSPDRIAVRSVSDDTP